MPSKPPADRTGPIWRIAGVVAALVATTLAVVLAQGWGRPPTPPATGPVVLNGTDNAFIQLVIPMTEGAIALFDYLDSRPADVDPPLRALAGRMRVEHRSEVREMRSILAAGNTSEQNVHEGHQMPGMVTEARLAGLRAAPATETRSRAVALIRAHLEQTVLLCRGVGTSGASPVLKELAGRIRQARTAELSQLDGMGGAVARLEAGHRPGGVSRS
ncbi:DUF305 domain-containing protein [Phytohabitans rumicis]|uniref:DUF305 domain-containing protein n=1 Tax=Phytohabitans rumicis TaxID=1076125 RepID=A0A6V8KXQ9_9ACTN|nr:DUF305 domain-containing protein [Phytohabitans rumicis]GFJ87109.1 hypothetical protein Prum_007510 [Phytohabitans rumicis]